MKAKQESDKANGIGQAADAEAEVAIPGGVDVTSSITANVWEVHVKVSGTRPEAKAHELGVVLCNERMQG